MPEKVVPRTMRQVDLTAVILLLVASNRGVSVLPGLVLREIRYHSDCVTRPLADTGLTRKLFAAAIHDGTIKTFTVHLLKSARSQPVRMRRR
jgi:LysR family transcriptional regulator, regulator for metE and metH